MDDCVPHKDDAAQEDFIKLVNDLGKKTCLQKLICQVLECHVGKLSKNIRNCALKLLMPFHQPIYVNRRFLAC